MKKKRFYKNVNRNEKWTEPDTGRIIDFADKYIASEGGYSDKFDYLRPKAKKKKSKKASLKKLRNYFGIAFACLLIVSVGYTAMDIYMLRHSMPQRLDEISSEEGIVNEIALSLKSEYIDSVSLDGSVMLDAVIAQALENGYNSVTFDLKRSEGSVAYKSALANVDTYGAIAFPATDLKHSAELLKEQDILAVGRVYCYLDNLVPEQDHSCAVLNENGIPFRDIKDNTYLNPDSETAYKYIKDIISEAMEIGITVFVLDGTDLPDSISGEYSDGFETLSKKLYRDLGTDIKLLEAVNIHLSENAADGDSEADSEAYNELAAKLSEEPGSNRIYFISTSADKQKIKSLLDNGFLKSFILSDY